ncbi:MAG: transferase [SAR86 cluster bacterium]|uniref:Chloramphenicol acetyltransferase n=1 Tax=SAR86 cluster bacterium TaxID=2030880 RepID=A0A2A4X3T5_9GAMM|nr:MAG: transferase [SAR86 cluster bacterium]
MPSILNRFEKLKAKRRGIRIQDFSNISVQSHLIMEEHSRLGDVQVRLPKADHPLYMGAYSYMREGGEIWNLESIGRFCSIGRNVVLGQPADNHPIDWVSSSMSVSGDYEASCVYASIGHDVWIAHNVVVMAGVKIGNGAVIGRNAVVTKDVEPYQIVVGNPGKVVRTRFSMEQIVGLLKSEWWNSDYAALKDLPFDDVDVFLGRLEAQLPRADYASVEICNRKIKS